MTDYKKKDELTSNGNDNMHGSSKNEDGGKNLEPKREKSNQWTLVEVVIEGRKHCLLLEEDPSDRPQFCSSCPSCAMPSSFGWCKMFEHTYSEAN